MKMSCQHFDPISAHQAGVPSNAPVSLWCTGYRKDPAQFRCPYIQYATCQDVPE